MSQENDVQDSEVEEEELDNNADDQDNQGDDNDSDTTDWKAEALRLKGINKRYETKLAKTKETKTEVKPKSNESGEMDYGQKAFLAANGVKGSDEITLVKDFMQNTGKSLDDVLDSKYFQSELKELRDEKATKAAMPTGKNRSGQVTSDSVEYWLAKGELPPVDQRELRIKVVNARIAKEKNKGMFFNS
ncbi:MAG: hypothetical protein WCQ96_03075 [Patescibacteria group bacterium]